MHRRAEEIHETTKQWVRHRAATGTQRPCRQSPNMSVAEGRPDMPSRYRPEVDMSGSGLVPCQLTLKAILMSANPWCKCIVGER